MFDEIKEEEKLKKELREFTKDLKADKSIYYKIIARCESSNKLKRGFIPIFKVLVPLTLSMLIIFSAIFPVFGNNGTLLDLINTYRINKSINNLRNVYASVTDEQTNLPIDSAIMQTVFEKECGLAPQAVYKLRVQNPDDVEIITIVILSNLTRVEPEKIIEMRKNNFSWGIIARKKRIDPRIAMLQLEKLRRKLESQEKYVLIRGEVEAFMAETGSITVNTFPLKIYLSDETEVEGTIEVGKSLEIEAKYTIPSNLVRAIKVKEQNPFNIGIQSLIGRVVSINENSISILLKDATIKEVMFTPRTIFIPPQIPLIPGKIIRVDNVNDNGRLIALRIIQIQRIPPPPPNNPMRRR